MIPTIFIIERAVDTDKELIFKEISKIVTTIKSKPIEEISYFFDKDIIINYQSKEYNSKEYIEWLEDKLEDKQIKNIEFKKKKFSFKENSNQVIILAIITIITQDGVFRFPIKFNTIWKKYKIINIDFDIPLIHK